MSYELPPGSEEVGENWDDYTYPTPTQEEVKPVEFSKLPLKDVLIGYVNCLSPQELEKFVVQLEPFIKSQLFNSEKK